MAKQVVNKIIEQLLTRTAKRADKLIRNQLDASNPHLISFTKEDIKNTIKYSFIRILHKNATGSESKKIQKRVLKEYGVKKTKDLPEEVNTEWMRQAVDQILSNGGDEVEKTLGLCQKAADAIWTNYVEKYNEISTGIKAQKVGDYIVVFQPKIRLDNLKAPIFDIAAQYLPEEKFPDFTRMTQFLHKDGTTVGTATLDILKSALGGNEEGGLTEKQIGKGKNLKAGLLDDETILTSLKEVTGELFNTTNVGIFKKAGLAAINQIYDELSIEWRSGEDLGTIEKKYTKDVVMLGTIGTTLLNPPGAEPEDFKNIGPRLAELFRQELIKELGEDFITEAASMSPREKVARMSRRVVAKELKKAVSKHKTLELKIDIQKEDKAKTDSSVVKNPRKKSKVRLRSIGVAKKSLPRKGSAKSRASQGSNFNQVAILGKINQKLNEAVRKNMRYPGLERQTGRFANSVKATSIIQTSQGFPSIGYTYQKDPYQVFEVAQGRKPWATRARDPRILIDKSIREVAAEFVAGRFYTRRE